MPLTPTSLRLRPETLAYLDALAAWRVEDGRSQRASRPEAIEMLLERLVPPRHAPPALLAARAAFLASG